MYSNLFILVFLFRTVFCCNYTNTWIILENINDLATFPTVDYQNDTFCVSTQDMTNGIAYYSTTNLTDSSEKSHFQQLKYTSFDKHKSTCTTTNSSVQGCLSHCLDQKLEATVIQASISSADPKVIVQQISKTMSSNTVIISARLDPSDSTQEISFDYFNDANFCSVFVKVKNNLQFPYGIMTTVQRVV